MARIVIDPGHGGNRAMGKSSPYGAGGAEGTLEPAVNYALAERVQRLLGQDAILTRPNDGNRSLGERAAFARERGAAAFVSLHAHGRGSPTETWIHTNASERSLRLAEALGGRIAARFGAQGQVRRGDLAVLHPGWHAPGTAACLLDANVLAREGRNLDQFAGTIAEGLRTYLADPRWGRGARALDDAGTTGPTQDAVWSSEDEYRQACQNIEALFSEGGEVPVSGVPATAEALGFLPSVASLTSAQIATCSAVYGSSIDYGNVRVTDASGLGGRPFTIYVPIRGIQVINAGTLTPTSDVLIHEMAHVWQSQHASNPRAFMSNSVGSQAMAVAQNLAEGSTDPQWPYSSYAYVPGDPFGSYAAEQIANQVERGEPAIVAHVAGVAAGVTDADNDAGLGTMRVEDRRTSGVVY